MQERTDFVVQCLGACLLPSQLKASYRKKFDPEASSQAIADYVTRARKQMAEALARTRRQHAEKSLAGLEAIIRDPATPHNAKVRAHEVIISLLGAAEAQKLVVHHSASEKADIDERIDRVFGIVRRATPAPSPATNGNGHTNGHNGNGHHEEMAVDQEAVEATA